MFSALLLKKTFLFVSNNYLTQQKMLQSNQTKTSESGFVVTASSR